MSSSSVVYEDFGDFQCQVYEDLHFEVPQDHSGSSTMCSIKLNVSFTLIPSYHQDFNLDFLNDWDSMESGHEQHILLVELRELTKFDELSRQTLAELLLGIQVPPDQMIIRAIEDCARKMASDDKYKNQRVIGMVVDLYDILREIPPAQ